MLSYLFLLGLPHYQFPSSFSTKILCICLSYSWFHCSSITAVCVFFHVPQLEAVIEIL
jgi:hypothetical protein